MTATTSDTGGPAVGSSALSRRVKRRLLRRGRTNETTCEKNKCRESSSKEKEKEKEEEVQDSEEEEEQGLLNVRKRYRKEQQHATAPSSSEYVNDSDGESSLSLKDDATFRKRYRRIVFRSAQRPNKIFKPTKSKSTISSLRNIVGHDVDTVECSSGAKSVANQATVSQGVGEGFTASQVQGECVLETQITASDFTVKDSKAGARRNSFHESNSKQAQLVESVDHNNQKVIPESIPIGTGNSGKCIQQSLQDDEYECVPESPYTQDACNLNHETEAMGSSPPKHNAQQNPSQTRQTDRLEFVNETPDHHYHPKSVHTSSETPKKARTCLGKVLCDQPPAPSPSDMSEPAKDQHVPGDIKSVSGVFQFASGKPVHISEEALDKARTCLGEVVDEGPPAMSEPAKDRHVPGDVKSVSGVFQFASGKPVHISEEALDKARTCLGEVLDEGPPASASNMLEPSNLEFESDLARGGELFPVFDLHNGDKERCKDKLYYCFDEDPDTERITYKQMVDLNESMKNGTISDPSSETVDILLKQRMFSCVSLKGMSRKTIISAHDFFTCMRGAGMSMVSQEWVEHHSKMITMKFLKYELMFPFLFQHRILCAEAIYSKLCQRYKKEFVQKKWSCIHNLFMLEVHCSHRMILLVTKITGTNTIELSDGWYTIRAQLDKLLVEKLSLGKIHIGKKLCVSMGQIQNLQSPGHPLEIAQEAFVALHYNAVFPAKWDARLGFTCNPIPLVPLTHIQPSGGLVPSTCFLIEKQYPPIFIEKLLDGSAMMRNQESEQEAKDIFQNKRERIQEEVREKIQNQYTEEELANSEKLDQINQDYHITLEKSFRENSVHERNISVLLRLRVSQVTPVKKRNKNGGACISIWRPGEDLLHQLTPGTIFKVTHLMAKPINSQNGMLHLDSTKSSCWAPMGNMYDHASSLHFRMNQMSCDCIHSLSLERKGHEFDFSGVLVSIQRIDDGGYSVFMVSSNDMKKNGFEDDLPWLMRIAVGNQCTGLVHLDRAKPSQTLCFQNLSFDFSDVKNCIANVKAGIQSVITPSVKLCPSTSSCMMPRLRDRVESLMLP